MMKARSGLLAAFFLTLGVVLGTRPPIGAQSRQNVRPARVEAMQNMGLDFAASQRPVYLPPEWGRLVSVEKTGPFNYLLFLQANTGEIYLVRLIQNGEYLSLDTYDRGGVALVIKREP